MPDLLSRLVSKSLVAIDLEESESGVPFLKPSAARTRASCRQVPPTRCVSATSVFTSTSFVACGRCCRDMSRRRASGDYAPSRRMSAALEFALTSPSLTEPDRARWRPILVLDQAGPVPEGELWLERALAAAVHAPVSLRARAMIGLAHMHYFQGHYVEVADDATEALTLGRQVDDAWVVSVATFVLGLLAFESGNYEQAVAHAVAARQAADASGEFAQNAPPLLILANVAVLNGDLDRAQQLYDESIVVQRCAGDTWGLSISLSVAAGLRIVRNDFDQARAQVSEALSVCQELDDPRGIAWSLDVFAGLLAAGGEVDGAARDGVRQWLVGAFAPSCRPSHDPERYLAGESHAGGWSLPARLCRGTRDACGGGGCARASAVRSAPSWTSWNIDRPAG